MWRFLYNTSEVGTSRSRRRSPSRLGSRRGRATNFWNSSGPPQIPLSALAAVALAFLAYRLISESVRSRAFAAHAASRPVIHPDANVSDPAALARPQDEPVVPPGTTTLPLIPGINSTVGLGAINGPDLARPFSSSMAVNDNSTMMNATGMGYRENSTLYASGVLREVYNVSLNVSGLWGVNGTANGTLGHLANSTGNGTLGADNEDLGDYDTTGTTRAGLPIGNANHTSVEVRKGNDVLRIPRGSRLTGPTPEFGGALTRNGSILRGQNVTRVSFALYKIIKLFGFTSMVDSPAGWHTEWMPATMQRIEFDRPSFKYWGIDANRSALEAAREAIGAAARSDYRHTDVTGSPPAGVDLLFHWTELDGSHSDPRAGTYPAHIEAVLRSAKRVNATYIIFAQYPRLRGYAPAYRHGRWLFLGDAASTKPFLYNDYVRGVVPVMPSTNPYVLYMTFYSVRALQF